VDDVRVLLENEQRATAAASEKYRIAQQVFIVAVISCNQWVKRDTG